MGGYLPSCAWRGIWEAADLVLPLLFLLPWLARDGCACNFRWALGPPRAPFPARLALPSSEGWPEPFASSGVQPKGFPCGWPREMTRKGDGGKVGGHPASQSSALLLPTSFLLVTQPDLYSADGETEAHRHTMK